jgi:hypothetical protein
VLNDAPLLLRLRKRLYLDLDPGFTQLWADVQKIDMHFAAHTHHATIGLAIGSPPCTIPTCGIRLDHHAAADRPGALAGAPRRDRPRRPDHAGQLARLRLGRARREILRPEGALAPPAHRLPKKTARN